MKVTELYVPIVVLLIHETWEVLLAILLLLIIISCAKSVNNICISWWGDPTMRGNINTNTNTNTNIPSRGEKPPLRINSKSHNCLSESIMAGNVSASAVSCACLGKSRARRSLGNLLAWQLCTEWRRADLSSPPWGEFAMIAELNRWVCRGWGIY